MSVDIPLILFAKAPIAGKVKTRLMSHCSAQQAADIAERLMQASIKRACEAWPGRVYLSVWLDHEHSFFKKMLEQHPISLIHQCDGDLGEKMRDALHGQGYPAAVMGCDAPHVSAGVLGEAYRRLERCESVIGPALDGGYYLLGLSQQADALFKDKPWGQAQVFEQTLYSAKQLNISLARLEPLNDVDEWPDLLQAANQVPNLQEYLKDQGLV